MNAVRLLGILAIIALALALLRAQRLSNDASNDPSPSDVNTISREKRDRPPAMADLPGGEQERTPSLAPGAGRWDHTVSVATISGIPLDATISCEACGGTARVGRDGWGTFIHCSLPVAGRTHVLTAHRVNASSVSRDVVRDAAHSNVHFVLEPAFSTSIVLRVDRRESLSGAKLFLQHESDESIGGGEPLQTEIGFDSIPMSVVEELSHGFEFRAPIPVIGRTRLSTSLRPDHSVETLGRAEVILDYRTTGRELLVVREVTGEPVPGLELGVIDMETGHKSSCTTDRDGIVGFPPAVTQAALSLEDDGYFFSEAEPLDGVRSRGVSWVAVDLEIAKRVVVRPGSWRVRIVDFGHQPFEGPVTAQLEVLRPPNRWEIAFGRNLRVDGSGLLALPFSTSPSSSITRRLVVRAPGRSPARLQIDPDVDEALRSTDEEGLPMLILPESGSEFRVVLSCDGRPTGPRLLLGRRRENGMDEEFPIMVDSSGSSPPLPVEPGQLQIVDASTGAILGERTFRGTAEREIIELTIEINGPALSSLVVDSRGVGGVDLFAADRFGAIFPLDRDEHGVYSGTVPAGRYVVGPLAWVRNELHRLDDHRFGLELSVELEEPYGVPWEPRWASAQPVTTRVMAPIGRRLALIPVFVESPAAFVGDRAPHRIYLQGAEEITAGTGDPVPLYYVVYDLDAWYVLGGETPVAAVRAGSELKLDIQALRVEDQGAGLFSESLFLDYPTSAPELALAFKRKQLLPRLTKSHRYAEVVLTGARLTTGWGTERREVFPHPAASVGILVTVE